MAEKRGWTSRAIALHYCRELFCSSGRQVRVKAVREVDDASFVSGILALLAFGHYRLPMQYIARNGKVWYRGDVTNISFVWDPSERANNYQSGDGLQLPQGDTLLLGTSYTVTFRSLFWRQDFGPYGSCHSPSHAVFFSSITATSLLWPCCGPSCITAATLLPFILFLANSDMFSCEQG